MTSRYDDAMMMVLQHREEWIPSACMTCSCDNGVVYCQRERCSNSLWCPQVGALDTKHCLEYFCFVYLSDYLFVCVVVSLFTLCLHSLSRFIHFLCKDYFVNLLIRTLCFFQPQYCNTAIDRLFIDQTEIKFDMIKWVHVSLLMFIDSYCFLRNGL